MKKRTLTIRVLVTPEEKAIIMKAAEIADLPFSVYVRRVALKNAATKKEKTRITYPENFD